LPAGSAAGEPDSQLFANVYLNGFDHFVLREIQPRRYVRYVDDFLLFHEDKAFLKDAKARIGLSGFAYRTMDGFTFPGWRLFPDRRRLVRINVVRFNRRMKAMWKEHEAGTLEWDKIVGRVRAWDAHAAHGDPWRLREQIYDRFLFPPARSRKEGDLKIFFSGRLSRPPQPCPRRTGTQ